MAKASVVGFPEENLINTMKNNDSRWQLEVGSRK
jgi:hypothetical protein